MSKMPGEAGWDKGSGSYTMMADAAVDALIVELLASLRRDVPALCPRPGLAALLLGGGYGRGNGGLIERNGRRLPYNDLDFFVFSDGMNKRSREALDKALAAWAQPWAARLQIDLDFAPTRELSALATMPVTLMYQELRAGHELVWGDKGALARIEACAARDLPLLEGLRLLLNRGTGLLLAARRLATGQDDEASRDFIWRNLHKCALGCGDALLILTHSYDYALARRRQSLTERCQRQWPEPLGAQLLDSYERALAYKAQAKLEALSLANKQLPLLRQLWLASLEQGLAFCGRPAPGLRRSELLKALAGFGDRRRWWKNWLQNVAYGLASGLGTGSFMPPQCWLLQILASIHRGDLGAPWEQTGGLEWFLRRWQRFN